MRLIGLVARTQLTLSQIDARIPRAHVLRRDLCRPRGRSRAGHARGRGGGRETGTWTPPTACGSSRPTGAGCMVLPDPAEAVTHLWAEGPDDASAQALLDEWAAVVDSAGR